jgi:HSP20 family molecular chaperone IbpA
MRAYDGGADEMHCLFQGTFGQVRGPGAAGVTGIWEPPVKIYMTDDALVLQMELPGVSKDAVNVELHKHSLRFHVSPHASTRSL